MLHKYYTASDNYYCSLFSKLMHIKYLLQTLIINEIMYYAHREFNAHKYAFGCWVFIKMGRCGGDDDNIK